MAPTPQAHKHRVLWEQARLEDNVFHHADLFLARVQGEMGNVVDEVGGFDEEEGFVDLVGVEELLDDFLDGGLHSGRRRCGGQAFSAFVDMPAPLHILHLLDTLHQHTPHSRKVDPRARDEIRQRCASNLDVLVARLRWDGGEEGAEFADVLEDGLEVEEGKGLREEEEGGGVEGWAGGVGWESTAPRHCLNETAAPDTLLHQFFHKLHNPARQAKQLPHRALTANVKLLAFRPSHQAQ